MRLRSASWRIVHRADRHGHPLEAVRASQRKAVHRQRAPNDLLDGVVGQNPAGELLQVGTLGPRVDPILAARGDGVDRQAQVGQRRLGALGDVVGDARFEEHVDQPRGRWRLGPAVGRGSATDLADRHRFDERVDQQLRGGPFHVRLLAFGLNQKRTGRRDLLDRVGMQVAAPRAARARLRDRPDPSPDGFRLPTAWAWFYLSWSRGRTGAETFAHAAESRFSFAARSRLGKDRVGRRSQSPAGGRPGARKSHGRRRPPPRRWPAEWPSTIRGRRRRSVSCPESRRRSGAGSPATATRPRRRPRRGAHGWSGPAPDRDRPATSRRQPVPATARSRRAARLRAAASHGQESARKRGARTGRDWRWRSPAFRSRRSGASR